MRRTTTTPARSHNAPRGSETEQYLLIVLALIIFVFLCRGFIRKVVFTQVAALATTSSLAQALSEASGSVPGVSFEPIRELPWSAADCSLMWAERFYTSADCGMMVQGRLDEPFRTYDALIDYRDRLRSWGWEDFGMPANVVEWRADASFFACLRKDDIRCYLSFRDATLERQSVQLACGRLVSIFDRRDSDGSSRVPSPDRAAVLPRA